MTVIHKHITCMVNGKYKLIDLVLTFDEHGKLIDVKEMQ